MKLRRLQSAFITVFFVAFSCAGCAEKGPERYDFSGAVTFGGKPVPAGTIEFEPDGAAKNAGPQVVVAIKDGRYETPPGKGTVGGPHIVRIFGYDGVPNIEGGSIEGAAIFPPYETRLDLPKQSSTHDFDVPGR